jgi:hypothetical protein
VTVNDLITASLRRLRVISGADPPSGDDINDALLRFQDWLDDLRNQDFLDLFEATVAFTLTAGKTNYEIPGEPTLNIPNIVPFTNAQEIHNTGYRDALGNDYMLGPPLTDDAWAMIPNKLVQGARPSYFYFHGGPSGLTPGGGYRAFLQPWPVPNTAGLTGLVQFGMAIGTITLSTVLETTLNLPPGWKRFLRDGLALELAPEFHVSDPGVLGPLKLSADESKANIKRKGRRLRDLAVPEHFSMRGGGNIYTG